MTALPVRPIVTTTELVVSFSRWGQVVTAIDKVSIEVTAGEWVLLVGHNGAGKSTLLKALGGQLRPDGGRVAISGLDVNSLNLHELAAKVFTVHQDPLLGSAPLLTVFENLFVADLHGRKLGTSRTDVLKR